MSRKRSSVRSILFALIAAVLSITSFPVSPASAAALTTRLVAANQDPVEKYLYRYERITLDPVVAAGKVGSTGVVSFQAGYETFNIELTPHDLRAPGYV